MRRPGSALRRRCHGLLLPWINLLGRNAKYVLQISRDILAAQGFQESAFDQKLRMKSGAVGVMQIKPSTAKEELGIPDIVSHAEDNIHSAAAYLHFIIGKYISDPAIADREKVLMALAAYNGGPTALTRARGRKEKGLRPQRLVRQCRNRLGLGLGPGACSICRTHLQVLLELQGAPFGSAVIDGGRVRRDAERQVIGVGTKELCLVIRLGMLQAGRSATPGQGKP